MSKKIKHLIVIEGPTASGKTGLSIQLAKHFKTCVVSADSRQFYKELCIGTAKPTLQEQDGIKHHFIDSHSIHDEVTAAEFEKQALLTLKEEFSQKDIVILTGGSGMFIDALCYGLDPIPTSNDLKAAIQVEYDTNGLEPLLAELKENDLEYYNTVDTNNPMRIIRAIEVIRLTGKKYSSLRNNKKKPRDFRVHRYVINHSREKLYERINLRVDIMMKNGLLEEVKSVFDFRNLTSLNTVGYKELFEYFDGQFSLESAIEKIKQNTRRYAKRQLTWFKRHPESIWLNPEDKQGLKNLIINHFESLQKSK